MKRRDFLKYSGLLGLGGALPMASSFELYAAHDGYTGPLWLSIDARGGWDPTSFCDPKGYVTATDPLRINNYPATDIISIANSPFNVAPRPAAVTDTGYTAQVFFEKYKQELLLINGIDYQTNGHADGMRHGWSGELGRQGYPNFAALIAAELAASKAMPFITNGGYSFAAGLTTPVRINNSALTALREVAYPGRSQRGSSSTSRTYYPDDVTQAIQLAQQERIAALQASQNLPTIRQSIQKFINAGKSTAHMTDLADFLEATPAKVEADFNGRRNAFLMYQQGRIALAAYKTGVTATAHITMGGFDTHADHDNRQYPRLMDYMQAVDAIIEEARSATFGMAEQLVVTMGSDFGRTNRYNDGAGKDHWPISSMMFIGNTNQRITGNRIIGATNNEFKALKIDPTSLVVDTNDSNPNAVRLTPAHIHRSIRRLAGIENSAAANKFNLKGQDIDLFG